MPATDTSGVVVRELTGADVVAVSCLIGHTAFVSNAADYTGEVLTELAQWYSPENITRLAVDRVWLVAEDGGVVLGTISVVTPDEDSRGELAGFFVAPSAQGRGLGGLLLSAAVERARAMGATSLHCDSSLTAEQFYLRHGWRVLGRVEDGHAGPHVDMELVLTDTPA